MLAKQGQLCLQPCLTHRWQYSDAVHVHSEHPVVIYTGSGICEICDLNEILLRKL